MADVLLGLMLPTGLPCGLQVIAFLDTGSGKTFISVLLVRHCVSLVKKNPEDARVAVFLAPKVALVMQGQAAGYFIVRCQQGCSLS